MRGDDLGTESRAVEDAVMADAHGEIMLTLFMREVGAERVGGLRLADPGDVVALTLDGEEGRPPDRLRPDRPAAMRHLPVRQRVAHEHRIDGLQVELRGQVHHREIFVVELAMLLGGIPVSLHQMPEKLLMGADVAVEVHPHEARQLQEARIDVAHEARMREGHAS